MAQAVGCLSLKSEANHSLLFKFGRAKPLVSQAIQRLMNQIRMAEMSTKKKKFRYSWHLLLVVAVFLFLYGIAVYDYIMTVSHNQTYFEYLRYNQTVIDYFENYPLIPFVFWTINVFGGIVTLLLMLMEKEIAFYLSLITFVSMFLLDFATFGFLNRWNVIGAKASTIDIIMLILTLGLCIYNYFLFKKSYG
ncbi:MAG: hypothetical protein U0V02_07915 [Anaerolineales bacterium]